MKWGKLKYIIILLLLSISIIIKDEWLLVITLLGILVCIIIALIVGPKSKLEDFTIEEFDEDIEKICSNIQEEIFDKTVIKNKNIITLCNVIRTLFFIANFIMIILICFRGITILIISLIISLVICIALKIIATNQYSGYVLKYKKTIIPQIVRLVIKDSQYIINEEGNIKNEYKNAEFYESDKFNFRYIDEYIKAEISNETSLEIAEVYVNYGESIGFNGIFVALTLNKNIKDLIKIKMDNKDRWKYADGVEMDYEKFEEYADVYCKDKILAVRLINAEVMEILINFYERTKINYEIVIKNNKIYIRFNTGTIFEPNIFTKNIDKESIYIYYSILKFIAEVTEKINNIVSEIDV